MTNDLEKENQLLSRQIKNLESTLDHIGAYVYTKDLEGKYTYVNQSVRELFDYPLEDILGFDDSRFFSLELSNDLKINDQKVMREGVVIEKEEKNIISKTGETRYYKTVKKPLFDDSGNICGMFGVSTDITELKHTEQELKSKEEDQSSLIAAIPDVIMRFDSKGRHLFASKNVEQVTGIPASSFIGKTHHDLGFPEDMSAFWENAIQQPFITRKTYETEFQIDGPSGHRLFNWRLTPDFDAQGKVRSVLAIAREITRQKQAEQKLKLQAQVLDQIQDHVTVTDLEGNILYVNESEVRDSGYDKEKIIGQHVSVYGDDPEADAQQQEIVLKTLKEGKWQGEVINFGKENEQIFVDLRTSLVYDERHRPFAMVGIGTDITERKKAENALKESSELFKAILNGTKDGAWLIDIKGCLLEVNDVFCLHSGYTREELLGIHVSQLDDKEDHDTVNQKINQLIQQGNAIFETIHRRKDGSLWPVEASVIYSSIQGGRFIAFLRDITERKVVEKIGQLRQLLSEIVIAASQEELMQTALDSAEKLTDSQIGFFHLVGKDQLTVHLQTWSTRTLDEMCYAKGNDFHYPVSEAGVWVDCIHQRQPVIHNDYQNLPNKKGLPEGHTPVVRELTVPIFRDNQIVAVIGVGNKVQDYNESDVDVVTRLADMTYDFIERKKAEQQIKFMAFNDVLTGLPNRALFADRLNQALSMARRSEKLVAICYLDLDGFKPINDRFGHDMGDKLLIEFANRLLQILREEDTLARLGGDEFVILLNDLNNVIQGEEVITRLLESITQPFNIENIRLHVSASIGVTIFPDDEGDPDALLRHADQAMYKAKESGKNTFKLYDPIQDQKVQAVRQALDEFGQALQQSQLRLHFQPRIDLRSGDLAGVEALVRWQHPEKGLLYPDKFLPLIEDSPLEIALDEWVIKAALDQHLDWRKQGLTIPVSVNLSPRHIQQEAFPDYLQQLLASYPEDLSQHLELEVLETGAIGDTARVTQIMNACAGFGVQFSLDDFGTGYSSLTYFHRLPINILKIDQNFVRDMLIDSRDQDIVEGVLRLAEALNRPVVAEGVENVELGLMLVQLGCQYAQGYGIAKPMPAESLPDWLKQWKKDLLWHGLYAEVQGQTIHYDLFVSIYSHRLWLNSILQYVKSNLTTTRPSIDSSSCQFSRWYKGLGASRYGTRSIYPFIQAKHAEVHRLAEEILILAEAQTADSAQDKIHHLTSVSDELILMLKGLAKE